MSSANSYKPHNSKTGKAHRHSAHIMADLKQYVTIKNAQGICLVCVFLDKIYESMGFEKQKIAHVGFSLAVLI